MPVLYTGFPQWVKLHATVNKFTQVPLIMKFHIATTTASIYKQPLAGVINEWLNHVLYKDTVEWRHLEQGAKFHQLWTCCRLSFTALSSAQCPFIDPLLVVHISDRTKACLSPFLVHLKVWWWREQESVNAVLPKNFLMTCVPRKPRRSNRWPDKTFIKFVKFQPPPSELFVRTSPRQNIYSSPKNGVKSILMWIFGDKEPCEMLKGSGFTLGRGAQTNPQPGFGLFLLALVFAVQVALLVLCWRDPFTVLCNTLLA